MRLFVYRPDGSLRISVGAGPDGKLAHPVRVEDGESMAVGLDPTMNESTLWAARFTPLRVPASIDTVLTFPPLADEPSGWGWAL